MKNILIIFCLSLAGCTQMQIQTSIDDFDNSSGLLVTASHNQGQFLLYFNSGLRVSIDNQEPVLVPWRESKLFPLEPGQHTFEVWFNYMGKSGHSQGCIQVSEQSKIQLKYESPTFVTADGKVQIIDLAGKGLLPLNSCANNESA